MPFGIFLFVVFLVLLEIFYFFFDLIQYGLFAHYGFILSSLGTLEYLLVMLFLFALVIIALYAVTIGFFKRLEWARKFTMIFVPWASLWALWGIIVGNQTELHILLLILYLLAEYYLISQTVKDYFKLAEVYKYGEWTLYRRDVKLKSGKSQTIHFFSKQKPHSGIPTCMPEGYEVGVSDRSKMPFLKKIGNEKQRKTVAEKTTIIEDKKERRPSNVIYVVNKPQPGQVRGDWAVRGHGKIYSHHRTKINAVRAARKIARGKDATVMVQRTDGTFSMGFKPKKK